MEETKYCIECGAELMRLYEADYDLYVCTRCMSDYTMKSEEKNNTVEVLIEHQQ